MKRIYYSLTLFISSLCISVLSFAQDYTSYNDLAKTEYDKKSYYNVIDYANKSLNATKNGVAYWYRGMARYYLNNYMDAAEDFGNAISFYTSDNTSLASLYYWRASSRYNQKNYKQSLDDFESAKSYGYENKLNMYWCMAFANYSIAEYGKADELYSSAFNYTSDNAILAQLYKGRGDARYELFKNEDAISDYTKAIEYNANYSYAFWARGIARALNFQPDLATGDYTSAINIMERENKAENGNDLSILYSNRGRNQYTSGKYDEAKTDLQKSLGLNPNNDKANWNMGDLLYILKSYNEAAGYYLRAASLLAKDADKETCYKSLYLCSINRLDYTQALSYINSAIAIRQDNGDRYQCRGHVLSVKKDYVAALADFNKAIDLYTDDKYGVFKSDRILIYIDRAALKVKMKDNTGALVDFKKAVEEDSSYNYSYYHLGRFYKEGLKQNALASVNLQKAADLSVGKDTASEYAYAKVMKGEKPEAFSVIAGLIKKETDNKDRLKWEIYNAACIYALAGDATKALNYLERSFAAGFDDYDHLFNDEDLDWLRPMPAFKAILAKYKVPPPKL